MTRRLPFLPTIIVAAAVATMIGLGFWQLSRAREKEALLAAYSDAHDLPPITYPSVAPKEPPLFRKATGFCLQPVGRTAAAGRSVDGEPGFVHVVTCRTGAEGPGMAVEIGWSKDPNAKIQWKGGPVTGVIGPDRSHRLRLHSDRPAPGLQPSAPPSLDSIPNNHRLYAGQWFLFAVIAAAIYLLALRSRMKKAEPR